MAQVSPAEIGRLIDEQGRALRLYAAQWTDVPDDVVQEAVIALAALDERPRDPVSWLYGVVRNQARMIARGERRRRRREQRARESHADWFETSLDTRLDAQAAETALLGLSEESREIIIARIWGDLTFEQIAEIVGTSSSTVQRRFVAGLEELRERLGVTWIANLNSATN